MLDMYHDHDYCIMWRLLNVRRILPCMGWMKLLLDLQLKHIHNARKYIKIKEITIRTYLMYSLVCCKGERERMIKVSCCADYHT